MTEGPYIDWMRTHVRDARFDPEMSTSVTETGELPEEPDGVLAGGTFDEAVLDVSWGLSTRALWTLHHLARPIAQGRPRAVVAGELGIEVREALELLLELETELRRAA